ncbi:MAG: porin family protein [Bacteroidales bacterium]|nr:PorT family protein [Bacteroidales bacterium]MDD4214077.1 porin family protein [Bacteroidales bacterium]
MKTIIKYFSLITFVFLLCGGSSFAQYREHRFVENLPKFDKRRYHFGFLLGMNYMDFALKSAKDLSPYDSLTAITTKPDFGFDIGIVSSLTLTKYLSLRFVPTLSFGNRTVEYTFLHNDSITYKQSKRIESTFMFFPLYLKYQSKRIGNFRAYVIGGAKYAIDMASQAKKKNKEGEAPIKLRRSDVLIDVGTGLDFFLPYFKFGIELKMSYGLPNLLIPENTIYTNSIRRLGSKLFQLSLTFEG